MGLSLAQEEKKINIKKITVNCNVVSLIGLYRKEMMLETLEKSK